MVKLNARDHIECTLVRKTKIWPCATMKSGRQVPMLAHFTGLSAILDLPDIPYFQIELLIAGAFVLALGSLHLWRTFRAETRPRKCVFCGVTVPPDEHAHHLEICGLKMIQRRGT